MIGWIPHSEACFPMIIRPTRWALLAALVLGLTRPAAAADDDGNSQLIPLEELLRSFVVTAPQISPNGAYLAAINEDASHRRNLVVTDLATGEIEALRGQRRFGFTQVDWLTNERLVLSGTYWETGVKSLFVAERQSLARAKPILSGARITIVGHPDARSENLVIRLQSLVDPRTERLLEVSSNRTLNRQSTLEAVVNFVPARSYRLPGGADIWRVFCDPAGEPAVVLALIDGDNVALLYDATTETARRLPLDPDLTPIKFVEAGGRFLWAVRSDDTSSALCRYNVETDTWDEPLVQEDSYGLEAADVVYSRREQRVVGVQYQGDRLRQKWFSADYAQAQAVLQQRNPRWDHRLLQTDLAERRFLFSGGNSADPGEVLLVDLDRQSIEVVASRAPHLDPFARVESQPVSFRADDGVKLDGYLTLPPGSSRDSPPPLIVIADEERATWSYDYRVQLFVSRGYAVLQPNHRGNSAQIFQNRIEETWNHSQIVTDLVAATRGLVSSGLVDPSRVAVFGEGFGGFVAVAATASAPDLFRCTAANRSIFDWEKAVGTWQSYNSRLFRYYRARLGFDEAAPNTPETTPLKFADQITTPVFLAARDPDYWDGSKQTKELARSLNAHGNPPKIFYGEIDGSGDFKPKDRLAYHRALLDFLARNLNL